jgi:hypothetical protein
MSADVTPFLRGWDLAEERRRTGISQTLLARIASEHGIALQSPRISRIEQRRFVKNEEAVVYKTALALAVAGLAAERGNQ